MAEPSDTGAVFGSRWRGIRPRLIAILLVPTTAALVLGGMRVEAAFADSTEAARAESIADALPASFHLAVQLTAERDAATSGVPEETLREVQAGTDDAIEEWRSHLSAIDSSHNPPLQRDLLNARESLGRIEQLREEIDARRTEDEAHAEYTAALNLLLGLSSRLPALDDQDLYRQTDALAQIRAASEALGTERRIVGAALATGEISPDDRTELTRAQGTWAAAGRGFFAGTSPAARESFDEITGGTGAEGGTGGTMQSLVDQLVTTGDVAALGITPEEWLAVSTEFIAAMEAVIIRAATDLADDVSATRGSAQRTAILSAVAILLVLIAALASVVFAARSIIRPLRRLRAAALDIAHHELPDRVRALEAADGPVDTTVDPIGIRRRDEIGEVTEAFEAVHAEAVRLAGEQAEMRANVNRMFVNLSRRSQSLVERQLRLIDQLEAGEQDPDDLAHLFQLDHLATRMRRNDESLLVLAGGDTGQTSRGNVPVLDVLRAAASEIEQFARVDVDTRETSHVRGEVAGDLVHLLAELVENATNFSPPDTRVTLRAVRGPAGDLVVEVRDHGIGMRPDELAAANAKLQRTSGLDADVARRMGLVVTARLAARHGLTVGLATNSPQGTVARVVVPPAALATPERPQPSYVVPAPVATPPVAAPPAPAEAGLRTWLESTVPLAEAAALARPALPPTAAPVPDPAAAPVSARPATAPRFPSLEPSALDLPARTQEEESPIFASLQSEWFTRRTPLSGRHRAATAAARTTGWSSPGDVGWQRAAEVTEKRQQPAAVTPGGLPKRVPGQHLVPGAAPAAAPPRPTTPDAHRARGLSSFQQGVRRARTAVDPHSPDHGTEGGREQ